MAVISTLYYSFNSSTLMCLFSGCEFFREYKDRDYTAEGLVFNWNQVHTKYKSLSNVCILGKIE